MISILEEKKEKVRGVEGEKERKEGVNVKSGVRGVGESRGGGESGVRVVE